MKTTNFKVTEKTVKMFCQAEYEDKQISGSADYNMATGLVRQISGNIQKGNVSYGNFNVSGENTMINSVKIEYAEENTAAVAAFVADVKETAAQEGGIA